MKPSEPILNPAYLDQLIRDAKSMYAGWLKAKMQAAQEKTDE